ncbi:GAF domain-containing protein [Mycobacterium sp. IDR2000157661]|uniref:GAF domain-containing protein n=1 Tax=Mycobacterium sp. IDR2000157661 TaxID=2867005 RepID=UPI001EEC17DD|nr:GAF domain-containing protein [Mycobacterium sp. IDR2000157661]ULE34113.1 GAF domain-containing protein [Mycobacterium sp. IDR2000157661]
MVDVYRAPMRSRDDRVNPQASLERALRSNLVGFGCAGADHRLPRRIERLADVADGSFVWTRDADGRYWLGRITGAYFHDDSVAAAAVDVVHVRPCRWTDEPVPEPLVPPAVVATFGRGGRNFQQTHSPTVGAETARAWDCVVSQANCKPH